MIQQLWRHAGAMWEFRNENLHGAGVLGSRAQTVKDLRRRIREVYRSEERKFVPPLQQKEYFGMPVAQRCRCGMTAMREWLDFVERRLRRHREEATKNTIHAWLQGDGGAPAE